MLGGLLLFTLTSCNDYSNVVVDLTPWTGTITPSETQLNTIQDERSTEEKSYKPIRRGWGLYFGDEQITPNRVLWLASKLPTENNVATSDKIVIKKFNIINIMDTEAPSSAEDFWKGMGHAVLEGATLGIIGAGAGLSQNDATRFGTVIAVTDDQLERTSDTAVIQIKLNYKGQDITVYRTKKYNPFVASHNSKLLRKKLYISIDEALNEAATKINAIN